MAAVFRVQFGVSALVAHRLARSWSQRDVAEAWTARWPQNPKTFKDVSYWESWPARSGREPSLPVLDRLAQLYECSVADLLGDFGDHRSITRKPRDGPPQIAQPRVSDAFARAESLEQQVAARWPYAFTELDRLRRNPPGRWPEWCLLPSPAPA